MSALPYFIKNTKFSIFVLVTCLYGICANAEGIAEGKFGYGKKHATLQLGYGAGFSFGFVGEGDGSSVEYFSAFPSFGVGISDVFADDSWYQGNFDLELQGEFTSSFKPVGGYSVGAGFLFRYNFLASKKFIPYIELGLGFGYLKYGLQDQSDGFVFSPQGGLGAYYFITDNIAINGAWKIHHMSNSGIEQPNNGINANVFLVGVSYFFD